MLQWRLSHTLNNPQTKTGEQEAGDDSEVLVTVSVWRVGDTGHTAESPYAI